MSRPIVGVSFKMYFSLSEAREWLRQAASEIPEAVEFFVAPSYLAIADALKAIPIGVAAQDVSAEDPGPFTGEVSAAELAEAGVRYVEIGHAERRRLYGETDEIVSSKASAALRAGLTPILCIGEPLDSPGAARFAVDQLQRCLDGVPSGRVIVAYEPVWAIGAAHPAPDDHIRTVCEALRGAMRESTDAIIYGGSAGPGLLSRLAGAIDGVFLGRFAHNPEALRAVLAEAVALK